MEYNGTIIDSQDQDAKEVNITDLGRALSNLYNEFRDEYEPKELEEFLGASNKVLIIARTLIDKCKIQNIK